MLQAKGLPPGRGKRMSSQHPTHANLPAEQALQIAMPVLEFGLMGYVRMDMEAYHSIPQVVDEDLP